jgi:hypothetical protein
MPSVSKKQHNLMAAVAHNPAFAKRVGIPQSVGKDFNEADKVKHKKFGTGGDVGMTKKVAGFFAKKGNKALAAHENREAKGKEEDTKSIAKREETALKGAPKSMKDYEHKEHKAMGFKKGGMPKSRKGKGINPAMLAALAGAGGPPPSGPPPGPMAAGPGAAPGMGGPPPGMGMKKGGMTGRGKQLSKTDTENKGGTSKIGGGIERKGATKTRVVSSGRGMGIAKTGTRPAKMYAKGGGIESKGKTRGRFC